MKRRNTLFLLISILLVVFMIFGISCKSQSSNEQSDDESVLNLEEGETIKIGAILSKSGGADKLGIPEWNTLKMMEKMINDAGGIEGHLIELIMEDDGTSEEKAQAAMRKFVMEKNVIAVLGPTTSGITNTLKTIANDGKLLLISCAASESIVNPVTDYVFKVAPNDSDAIITIFKDMQNKGISKIGVMSSTDGFGNGGYSQITALAADYGVEIVEDIKYANDVTDFSAQLRTIKESDAQAIINWNAKDPQSIIVQTMDELDMEIPIYQSHGFANVAFAQNCGEAVKNVDVYFPASRILIPEAMADDDPYKPVCVEYTSAYKEEYNEDISTFGGHAYDAINMLVAAIKEVGTDADKIIEYLEGEASFYGTAGLFNFSDSDHSGLDDSCFIMYRVNDNNEFEVVGE